VRLLSALAGGACAALTLCVVASPSRAALIGATPYTGFAGSPFDVGGSITLEDFEDGLLNVAGVSANTGSVLGPGFGLTDSVENAPDGCNPSGAGGGPHTCAGYSYYGAATTLVFTFSGPLPTHAGIVWTDVGYLLTDTPPSYTGNGGVVFEAFDQFGGSLGQATATLGDNVAAPMSGEDRFFGAIHAGGISRIEISMPSSNDWEVDHLQFGSVPEPATGVLVGLGLTGLIGYARRRG
jgi:hypothetical protein